MNILVLNVGSSSLKCELFRVTHDEPESNSTWQAQANWKELPGQAEIRTQTRGGADRTQRVDVESLEHTVEQLLEGLRSPDYGAVASFAEIQATGHRVVHGGDRFRQSCVLTGEVRQGITDLAPFAPLHNPAALEAIEAATRVLGAASAQIAVFDTSFHKTLPPESYLYAGPREWLGKGLRRYGFHGISYQYIAGRIPEMIAPAAKKDAPRLRVISCHLGNGCSLCAMLGGRSVETTMGFTPLEGLVMGSRSGTVDPGLILYLLRHDHYTVDDLDDVLNHQSGLKGLSGISSDLRQVTAAADDGNEAARQALAVYIYRLAYFIAALIPSLGGLDALTFSGGVGENSSYIRNAVCERLRFLRFDLDPERNERSKGDRILSRAGSYPLAAVIETRENLEIARECVRLLRKGAPV